MDPSHITYDSAGNQFLVNGETPTEAQALEISEFIEIKESHYKERKNQANFRFQLPGTAGYFISKESYRNLRKINPRIPLPELPKWKEETETGFETVDAIKKISTWINLPLTIALEKANEIRNEMRETAFRHLEKANEVTSKPTWYGKQYRGPDGKFISPDSELARIHEYNAVNMQAHLTLLDKHDKVIRDFDPQCELVYPFQTALGSMKKGWDEAWVRFVERLSSYFSPDSEKYVWLNSAETKFRIKQFTEGF